MLILCKNDKTSIKTLKNFYNGYKKCTKKVLQIKIKSQKCLKDGNFQKIHLNIMHKNGKMLLDGRNG